MLYGILQPLTRVLLRLLVGLEARGTANVPPTGPVLVVSNHSSVLDPPIVAAALRRQLHFMAKAELFRIPLLGRVIRRLNARPVRRGMAAPAVLRTALRTLEAGHVLLVFPEAARQPEGVLGEPRPGAGMLAVLSGAPVVPAFVAGSGRAWPKGRALPRPAKVRIHFGKPIQFTPDPGRDRKEQYVAASRRMMAAIAALKDEAKSRKEEPV